MAVIKKTRTTGAGEDAEKWDPSALVVGMQAGAATVEKV